MGVVLEQLVDKIATSLATMHSGDSIHGDLTTSNMMIKPHLPIDKQMSGEPCKLSAQEIAESGDIGDLVSAQNSFAKSFIWRAVFRLSANLSLLFL